MTDYIGIYTALDSTLRRLSIEPSRFDQRMDLFLRQNDGREVTTDDDYHWVMVKVAFYSGMNADTVTKRLPVVEEYLKGYQRVAEYDDRMVKEIVSDSRMLRNERKVRASIENARAMKEIVSQYGSFRSYLDSFNCRGDVRNIMRLRNDLRSRFMMLGDITSFHFMMDIGLPVIKPDRVMMRVFQRLGLVPSRELSEGNLLEVVRQGQLFSQATGKPIRQIDIMFVFLGQIGGSSSELAIPRGVCLEKVPDCPSCDLTKYCEFHKSSVNAGGPG